MKIDADVRTGSSKARIERMGDSSYKVYLCSAPDKGKANKELIEVISDHFGVSRSRVEILSGLRSNGK